MTPEIIDAINDHVFTEIVLVTACVSWLMYWWKYLNEED